MATLIFGPPVSGICNQFQFAKIRLYAMYSLIFFVCGLLMNCRQSEKTSIDIQWSDKRATGIAIPKPLLQSVPVDSLGQLLVVRLAGKTTAIAGAISQRNEVVIFEPLIPFTRGLHYTVWLRNNQLGELTIPALAPDDKPELLAIYPTQDSLPDNLLKIYLKFSRPMREGQSLNYVSLIKNKTDTLAGVFLDLQPELWNADRTILTLWLDPGRIKRDLQPNKRLGTPLQAGEHYQLVVSRDWPDQQGATLAKPVAKSFRTISRDGLSPTPTRWTISQPKSGGEQPLEVAFGEALDYSLLTETMHVFTPTGQLVAGSWQIGKEEKMGLFTPDVPWQTGEYRIRIEGRLEDLAGNNLNRLFDRDITRKELSKKSQSFAELRFVVR
ncbi:Ig-like domain-containing domain [Spirosoma litoris]